jgi:hypothetical protein
MLNLSQTTKAKKGLEIVRTKQNRHFVRVRKDNHSIEQLEKRAVERADSDSWSKEAWKAIRDDGIAEIIRPEGFQDMNDKDAYMAKRSFIEALKITGHCVMNNPKKKADLKVA